MKNKLLFLMMILCLLLISSCTNIKNNTTNDNDDSNNETNNDEIISDDIIMDDIIKDEPTSDFDTSEDIPSSAPEVDFRGKLVNLAYSQVGIYEGKDSKGNYNNMQKYGAWYGNNGAPWCAMFVSWNWHHAGLSHDLLLKYQGCYTGKEWCEKKGIFKYKKNYTCHNSDNARQKCKSAKFFGLLQSGNYQTPNRGSRHNSCRKCR